MEKVVFHSPETGWAVLRVFPDSDESVEKKLTSKKMHAQNQDLATVVGFFSQVYSGEVYTFKGNWTQHPKHGSQFKAESYYVKKPTTLTGIEKYLASGLIKGIGPATAKRIVKKFGLQTLDVLDENPERLQEIPGIGPSKFETLLQAWKDQKSIQEVMVYCQQYSISVNFAVKIFKKYGDKAIQILSENPYRLALDIYGVGFKSADKIAREIGMHAEDPKRLSAGIVHILTMASDSGHCYLGKSNLFEKTLHLLEISSQNNLESELESMVLEGRVICDDQKVYLSELYHCEKGCAERISQLLDKKIEVDEERVLKWVDRFEESQKIELSQKQKEAILQSALNSVFILTGGPGTGKTTTTRGILKLLRAMGNRVLLASPTGRAAQRLSEVVGAEAKTIHRLLEFDPIRRKFKRDESNPLETDVLILDEVSMLDIYLAFSVFKALPKGAQVILIGDSDQLPSVGPGNVLKDLLENSHVAKVHLDEIFRQAKESMIIQAAHQINRGEYPPFRELNEGKSDFYFLENDDAKDVSRTMVNLVTRVIPQRFQKNPMEIQVLTPMNRGEIGTQQLNVVLQESLNPEDGMKKQTVRSGQTYREGDRIIQRVNNYDLQIFNGDLGVIQSIDNENQMLKIEFGERLIDMDFSDLNEVSLAYAVSIHKSQGSEFNVVVVPVHNQHYALLTRNLIYTGLTRGKNLVFLVGSKKALGLSLKRSESQKRHTNLNQRLTTFIEER